VATTNRGKRNVMARLDRATFEKAKNLAARRSTSLSELVACRIELIFSEEESYKRSERHARELLERGFHLGGGVRVCRDELHGRKARTSRPDLENRGRALDRRKKQAT